MRGRVGVDGAVGASRSAQALRSSPSRRPGGPRRRRSPCRGRSVGAAVAGDDVGDPTALEVGGVGERDEGLLVAEPVDLLDRVADGVDVGALVRKCSSTAMPPRSPTRRPAAWARVVSGRTPMAATTRRPAGRCRRRGSRPRRRSRSRTDRGGGRRRRRAGPVHRGDHLGVEGGPSPGVASTRATCMPRWTRFSVSSTPMKPPPMTTAVAGSGTRRRSRGPRRPARPRRQPRDIGVLDVAQGEGALDAGDRGRTGRAPGRGRGRRR